jgi:hypothetical protein
MRKDFTKSYCPRECNSDLKFRIPLYQRPYAWTDKQVRQLLEDLYDASQIKQPYYIGLLNVALTESDEDCFDVIDGQQRLTTLVLLGRVLKEYGCEDTKRGWNAFLEKRLHLYGRDQDQAFMDTISVVTPENPVMRSAVNTINQFIEEKAKDERGNFDRAGFSAFVLGKTRFFISPVPKGYTVIEKNQQFVRINNRGKQLEKHHILMVKLLSKISDSCKRSESEKAWMLVSQMGCEDSETNKEEDNDGQTSSQDKFTLANILETDSKDLFKPKAESEIFYSSILSFPEFLLIALKRFRCTSASYNTDKLLEKFNPDDSGEWTEERVLAFIELVKSQKSLLNNYFITRVRDGGYKFREKSLFCDAEGRTELLMAQAFMYVSHEPQKWLYETFKWLANNFQQGQVTIKSFVEYLEKLGESERITEAELNNGCSTPRYWFYRLDYELWKKREFFFKGKQAGDYNFLAMANKFVFRTRSSVEHILAQKDGVTGESQTDDRFGNLALLTVSENSKLSNHLFGAKRELLERWDKGFPSLKLLHAFTYSEWKSANIDDHQGKMLELLPVIKTPTLP